MSYLRILLSSGAEALERDAPAQLRETLKRFEPTGRDAAQDHRPAVQAPHATSAA